MQNAITQSANGKRTHITVGPNAPPPPPAPNVVQKRGRARDMDTIVKELLAELEDR